MKIYWTNKNDWDSHFWKHRYVVTLDLGVEFNVNADNGQDALDYVIDYCEDHCPGFVAAFADLDDDERNEYYCGGNAGLYLTSDFVGLAEV